MWRDLTRSYLRAGQSDPAAVAEDAGQVDMAKTAMLAMLAWQAT